MSESYRLGQRGEQIAKEYFITKGSTIMAERWKLNHLELDLVVFENGIVVFVEVKTRTETDGVEAVVRKKRRNMQIAANAFLRELPVEYACRFDIVAITFHDNGTYSIEHIENAFLPSLRL